MRAREPVTRRPNSKLTRGRESHAAWRSGWQLMRPQTSSTFTTVTDTSHQAPQTRRSQANRYCIEGCRQKVRKRLLPSQLEVMGPVLFAECCARLGEIVLFLLLHPFR